MRRFFRKEAASQSLVHSVREPVNRQRGEKEMLAVRNEGSRGRGKEERPEIGRFGIRGRSCKSGRDEAEVVMEVWDGFGRGGCRRFTILTMERTQGRRSNKETR